MTDHAHHLQDERLFDCYLVERTGDAIDPPAAEHLSDCSECSARYTELVQFMEALRAEAAAETGELFPPARLRSQQQQILRRLEHMAHPARVISFPGRTSPRRMSATGAQGVARWVYAAAAAGLVIGVALGSVYKTDWPAVRQSRVHQLSGTRTAVGTRGVGPAPEAADEAFLSDLDVALEQPHTRSLQSFEALTPHVRDIKNSLR